MIIMTTSGAFSLLVLRIVTVPHSKIYYAHDEKNEFKVGDRVEIMEHRPISKDKRWKVIRLVARAVEE